MFPRYAPCYRCLLAMASWRGGPAPPPCEDEEFDLSECQHCKRLNKLCVPVPSGLKCSASILADRFADDPNPDPDDVKSAQARVRDRLQTEKKAVARSRREAADDAAKAKTKTKTESKVKAAKTEKRRVLALERVVKAAEEAAATSEHVAAALADALEEYNKVKNHELTAPSPDPDNDPVQLDA